MRGLALGCLVAVSWAASTASAADIFVDNVQGDDRRNGQAPQSLGTGNGPVRTIAKAMRLADKGDRVVLAATGQPYRESVTVSGGHHSGMAGFPFELMGNGATLDGSISLADAEWEFVSGDIFRVRPPRGAFQRLFLSGELAEFVSPAGDLRPQLKPKQWTLIHGWIYFRVEKDMLPSSYDLACGGRGTGITLYQVDGVVIRDLTVRGFQLDGINAHDTAREVQIVGVDSSHNGRSGFTVAGASRVMLDQCSAAGNGNSQLRVEGYSQTRVRECDFDETSAPALVHEGGRLFRVEAN